MKNLSFIIAFLIIFAACEEKPPDIQTEANPTDTSSNDSTPDNDSTITNPTLIDTTYIAESDTSQQDKKVLIEDFTAVRCNNCPKATNIIKQLLDQHGDRIIPLAVHSNEIFSRPYEESKENYLTEKGQQLYEWFENPAQPAGVVDRYLFQGEETEVLDYNIWKQKANERLQTDNKVNVYLDQTYSESENETKISLKFWFLEALEGRFYYTLVLTENNIIDYQLSQENGKIPDYEHDFVVRKYLTYFNGDLAVEDPQQNQVFHKEFETTLEEGWDPQNMEITAIAHKKLDEKTVLQANQIPIQ